MDLQSCTLSLPHVALKAMTDQLVNSAITGFPTLRKETQGSPIQQVSHSPFQLAQTLAVTTTVATSSALSAYGHGSPGWEC